MAAHEHYLHTIANYAFVSNVSGIHAHTPQDSITGWYGPRSPTGVGNLQCTLSLPFMIFLNEMLAVSYITPLVFDDSHVSYSYH